MLKHRFIHFSFVRKYRNAKLNFAADRAVCFHFRFDVVLFLSFLFIYISLSLSSPVNLYCMTRYYSRSLFSPRHISFVSFPSLHLDRKKYDTLKNVIRCMCGVYAGGLTLSPSQCTRNFGEVRLGESCIWPCYLLGRS